jgi:thiamine pyrophosphate-dependent acetolactate synthase large subunit-like protein
MNRIDAIQKIYNENEESFFILSNGLTTRESVHHIPNRQSFYLLHAMGEAFSVGLGLAQTNKELKIVVIEGDGGALMGMSSWSMKDIENIKYYVLVNHTYQTTGGQLIPNFPSIPNWVNLIKIENSKIQTPNPPHPGDIWDNFQKSIINFKV